MVHYGKHIIDPDTGLCEICDRGAIHNQRQGKKPTKQFFYSNQDGKFTYRPGDHDQDFDEPITNHRTTRKPTQSVPARSRLDTYEDQNYQTRRVPTRRENTPPDESPRRYGRTKVFYEVDDDGQIYPRDEGPPEEPRRRYLIQPVKNDRPANVHHRRALTPPPPQRHETRHHRPRHTNNSDSEIVERHSRHPPPPPATNHHLDHQSRAEMYYIDANPRGSTRTFITYDDSRVPPPKSAPRRRQQLEPIDRRTYYEAEPVVERRVYKKLPTTRSEPAAPNFYTNDGEQLRLTRKVETIYPPASDRSHHNKQYATVYQIDADHRH